MFKYMGHMHLCNAPSVNNCYWINVYNCSYFRWSRQANKENYEIIMKELRERTVAISQELDKVVCQAQKLIAKEGLDYIEAVEKAKELIESERVGAHINSD